MLCYCKLCWTMRMVAGCASCQVRARHTRSGTQKSCAKHNHYRDAVALVIVQLQMGMNYFTPYLQAYVDLSLFVYLHTGKQGGIWDNYHHIRNGSRLRCAKITLRDGIWNTVKTAKQSPQASATWAGEPSLHERRTHTADPWLGGASSRATSSTHQCQVLSPLQ